jgi:hypothetical protein
VVVGSGLKIAQILYLTSASTVHYTTPPVSRGQSCDSQICSELDHKISQPDSNLCAYLVMGRMVRRIRMVRIVDRWSVIEEPAFDMFVAGDLFTL